jgi:GNAT superfamily N-acetyltransferase
MDKARIRKGILSDLDAVTHCIEEAYASYVLRIGKRPTSVDTNFGPLLRNGCVWVLECDGTVVALMVLIEREESIEIRSVAVLPEYQRQGFGGQLMAHAEQVACDSGWTTLRLYTNARLPELVTYYARLGYRETERKQESGYDRVFMMKSLDRPEI